MDFWQFVGSYWWLIFPIGGAAATALTGIGKAWERNATRRHAQRLETIRAQQGALAAPATAAEPAMTPSALDELVESHDAVTARWLEYELDVAKAIAYPAMSDGRQPLVAAFLRVKKVADRLRPAPDAKPSATDIAAYRDAVTDLEVAFDIAERDARRLGDSSFSPEERKRLETAQQLLRTAVDDAASAAERRLAYRRVRDELDGLLLLSDDAIHQLEQRVAGELGPGTR